MLKTITDFAGTTELSGINSLIDAVLQSLRISGSVLLRETYASPWGIDIPDKQDMAKFLGLAQGQQVIVFHLVEFGHCSISTKDGRDFLLKAGEMLICFGGESHRLSQGGASVARPISELLAGGPNIQRPSRHVDVEGAALLCGVFVVKHAAFNPLFNALPAFMQTALSRQGEFHNLSGVAKVMSDEIERNAMGSGYIVERLLEVLCAEAIRAYVESGAMTQSNWLFGIKDPVIGKAIAAMHEQPGLDWSVQRIAEQVRMSPSRFAARFSSALGESPMAYLTKWRMSLACVELEETRQSVDLIAGNVGYESPAAFSRAFKKHLGLSPAAWRAQFAAQQG